MTQGGNERKDQKQDNPQPPSSPAKKDGIEELNLDELDKLKGTDVDHVGPKDQTGH